MSAIVTAKFLVDADTSGDALNILCDLLVSKQRSQMPESRMIDFIFTSWDSNGAPIPQNYEEGDWA